MISENKIVISKIDGKFVSCHIVDGKSVDIYSYDSIVNPLQIGTIINGKVEKNLPDISSCFVRIDSKISAFLNKSVKPETIIQVQIQKSAFGSKKATVTDNLSISGVLVVLSNDFVGVRVSNKAKNSMVNLSVLENYAKELNVGVIIRTKAFDDEVEVQDIIEEIDYIYEKINYIRSQSNNRPLYHVFYRPLPEIIDDCISLISSGNVNEIVTDIDEIYNLLNNHNDFPAYYIKLIDQVKVRLYKDELLSLSKLYAFETKISEATSRRIYLDNGANITFDQTEALLAIDVNSASVKGKMISKEENVLLINKEAAKEIFRHFRLRSLCGIIMIDFINMKSKDSYDELEKYINELASNDCVKLKFHGFTKLGLAEISRQKTKEVFSIRG